jgi:uncharacterized protein (TIGR02421 family)
MKINQARWHQLDELLVELQGDIDLDNYLSPANRAEELHQFKQALAEGRDYNPRFTFDQLPEVRENDLRTALSQIHRGDPVESIYADAIDYRLGEIEAARTHSADLISRLTTRMYGRPDESLLRTAWHNLKTIRPDQSAYQGDKSGRVHDAEELALLFREAMKHYGFDWKVVVVPEMGAKVAVDNLIREFWVRADVRLHESLVRMMIVHEIGTHILRSENGYAQPLKIFGRGMPAYQFTEEGLAEYAEERSGVLHDDTIHRISGRLIAVDAALNHSFWDCYLLLKDHFETDMVFDIVQRAKLGLADTALPGSFTKDYTYLAGLIKMREFFRSPSQDDIDALFAGKVGLHQFATVKALQKEGYLAKPKAYPEWLR